MKSKYTYIIISFLFLTFLSSLNSYAQTYDSYDREIKRVQFIVRGGFSMTNTTRVVVGQSDKESLKIGYNAGLLADLYLGRGIYLQSGVTLTTKGSRIKNFPINGKNVNLQMNTLYLQVPLLFAFKIPVGNTETQSFNLAIGPYYAHGLDGEIKGKGFTTVKTFGDEGVCKKTEIGLDIEVQYEASRFYLFYGAEVGFSKIMDKERLPVGFKEGIKNYQFKGGIGFKF